MYLWNVRSKVAWHHAAWRTTYVRKYTSSFSSFIPPPSSLVSPLSTPAHVAVTIKDSWLPVNVWPYIHFPLCFYRIFLRIVLYGCPTRDDPGRWSKRRNGVIIGRRSASCCWRTLAWKIVMDIFWFRFPARCVRHNFAATHIMYALLRRCHLLSLRQMGDHIFLTYCDWFATDSFSGLFLTPLAKPYSTCDRS